MLEVKNISFSYDILPVLSELSFSVPRGQHLSVMGESGCGKSTLLKIIYGLLQVSQGEIFYNNEKLLGPDFHLIPGEDFMKYQAQDSDLMPFTTVEENVGKYLSNFYKDEKKKRTKELLELVGMSAYAYVKTLNLSGGQQQRIALAKVLAKEPEIILLDEPFSSIDNFKKNHLRRNLFAYFKEKNITCIVATHDIDDALAYADEILVLKKGEIVSRGTPENLYRKPPDIYVASLFGEVSELPVHLLIPFEDKEKTVVVYPHEIYITKKSALKVVIKKSYYKGHTFLHEAYYGDEVVFFENPLEIEVNKSVFLVVDKKLLEKRI